MFGDYLLSACGVPGPGCARMMNVFFALRELMFQIDEINKQTNIIIINSKSVIKKKCRAEI